MSSATALDPSALAELAPLLRRAVALDPAGVVRLRIQPDGATALVRLPFAVLAGRRISGQFGAAHDGSYRAAELLGWIDGDRELPAGSGDEWRATVPPESGWRRVEVIPDDVVRGLVRQGALTLKQAAEREGIPGAQPRAEVADALLDSVVLTATNEADRVEVSLRSLSALVRMGFLARGSHLAVDITGRWVRLTASYGSVYAEREGFGLTVLRPGRAAADPHGRIGR
jgi:hypothetical protein